ncbi:MAG: Gfo/Idh/MocA family oxidoreductase, partial [Caldilineaceae bacterium]|nr:Gfo/Idh/MocA family oxidoreductase [Caldilineaceae bacterium]
MRIWKVGIVGCGVISRAYVKGLAPFEHVAIAAVADLNPNAAAALAAEIGCPALEVEDLLDRSDIDIVLNLTIPKAHAE